jgi:hypothetical protein
MDQLRVGTLLVMALAPGTGEGDARDQAQELLHPDPTPDLAPPKRSRPSAARRFVDYFFGEQTQEPLGIGTVRLTIVSVRSGPSFTRPTTDTLDGGTHVQVWAECEGWLLISELDGARREFAGWVGAETIK